MVEPGRLHDQRDRGGRVRHDVQRMPVDVGDFADRLRGEFGQCDVEQCVGAGRLQRDDLRIDGRIGGLVGRLGDDHRLCLVAERGLQRVEVVLAVIVVLVQHRDLRIRLFLQNELGESSGLADKAQIAADSPWVVLWVAEARGAGEQKHLRHLALVQIALHRGVGRGPERAENTKDLVLLDEPAGLLDRLGRAVAVVEGDEIDLTAVDPAGVVDRAVEGRLGAPDRREGRGRAAIGDRLADFDLSVGNPGGGLTLGRPRVSGYRAGNGRDQHQTQQKHGLSPADQTNFIAAADYMPRNIPRAAGDDPRCR